MERRKKRMNEKIRRVGRLGEAWGNADKTRLGIKEERSERRE